MSEPTELSEGSGRSLQPYRLALGNHAAQRDAVLIGTGDGLDLELDSDDAVGADFLGFTNERPQRDLSIVVVNGSVRRAPTRGGLDVAERNLCAIFGQRAGIRDLHGQNHFQAIETDASSIGGCTLRIVKARR